MELLLLGDGWREAGGGLRVNCIRDRASREINLPCPEYRSSWTPPPGLSVNTIEQFLLNVSMTNRNEKVRKCKTFPQKRTCKLTGAF